jgi:hypothetical protein
VAVGLQALPALVLVHLQTTFLFQVAHVVRRKTVCPGVSPVKPEMRIRRESEPRGAAG